MGSPVPGEGVALRPERKQRDNGLASPKPTMRIAISVLSGAAICVLLPGATDSLRAANPNLASAAAPAPEASAEHRALLDRYCVTCHNERLKTAGLALDALDLEHVGASAEVWERVVRKLRAGVMPPAGRPRPDHHAYDDLATWLEAELDRATEAYPNPGRTEPFHRLNRAEYRNAVRDLLALDVDIAEWLPPDDASYGFDNIAGVLKMSPTLMDRYLAASRRISRLAVGTPVTGRRVDTYRFRPDAPQDHRLEGLPFGTRGGANIRHTFPVDGIYVIHTRALATRRQRHERGHCDVRRLTRYRAQLGRRPSRGVHPGRQPHYRGGSACLGFVRGY